MARTVASGLYFAVDRAAQSYAATFVLAREVEVAPAAISSARKPHGSRYAVLHHAPRAYLVWMYVRLGDNALDGPASIADPIPEQRSLERLVRC